MVVGFFLANVCLISHGEVFDVRGQGLVLALVYVAVSKRIGLRTLRIIVMIVVGASLVCVLGRRAIVFFFLLGFNFSALGTRRVEIEQISVRFCCLRAS